jgi:hypothetical protein
MLRGATLIGRWFAAHLRDTDELYARSPHIALSISCPWITAELAALPTDDPRS